MSKDNIASIHDFEFQLIADFYSRVKRQGPGSPEVTLKALSFVENLDEGSRIADLGCGSGGQTMVLGQHTSGQVTGIDLFPVFIDQFNAQAKELGLGERVKGEVGSMDQLHFDKESLDLIWSEGAIYNIGFEEGLRQWREYLKPGAFVAVSEATWFTAQRPKEIEEFWQDAYPGIDTIPKKVAQFQEAGYMPVASFNIPENCWTEHFYEPMVQAEIDFLEEYRGNQAAEAFIENQRHETQLYYKYKEFYGYTFFIGKKL